MAAHPQSRLVNPLLGTYFSIFLASLVAIAILVLIFEQLGFPERQLRLAMAFGVFGLFAGIGFLSFTRVPAEYFWAGRRVPAGFSGLAMAVTAIGGTGLTAWAGAIFLIGFDALCIPLGTVAGLVVMAVLFAPYVRKCGAPSLPGFLGERFDSSTIATLAAALSAAPLLLMLVAELKVADATVQALTGFPAFVSALLVLIILAVTIIPGGARSFSWSCVAQALIMLFTLLVPIAVISVMETNLPFGQLSHGPTVRNIMRAEWTHAVPAPVSSLLSFDWPGQDFQAIAGRFIAPFSSIGSLSFVLVQFSVMLGVAASPALLARTVATPSVYETRKSIGWSVFLAGVVVMTLATAATFLRDVLMSQMVAASPGQLPPALARAIDQGMATIAGQPSSFSPMVFQFKRDTALAALPALMGFPLAIVLLVMTGIVAAALAAAAASLSALGIAVSESVIGGARSERRTDGLRLLSARLVIGATALVASGLAFATRGDPVDLMLWSLSLSSSTFFPVLMLGIWWKKTSTRAAFAGMIAGFVTAIVVLMAGDMISIGLPGALAPMLGVPVGFAVVLILSAMAPATERHQLEFVRDMRVPGGEALHDRRVRLLRQQRAREQD